MLDDVTGADHLNMDNQIEEGHCHHGHVHDPLEDAVQCPEHDEQMLEQISIGETLLDDVKVLTISIWTIK